MADLDPVFQAAGAEWNVDPMLLKAVSGQESGGTPNPDIAVSPAGASGRMQIMPATQKDLGVTDPSDPVQNIYGGAKYLSQMLDKYGTPERALQAYNAGPGRLDSHLATGAPLPAETQNYVPAVTARYQRLAQANAPAVSATQAPAGVTPDASPQGTPTVPPDAPPSDPFSAALSAAKTGTGPAAASDPFTQALAAAKQTAPAETATPPTDTHFSDGGGNEYGITSDPQQFNKPGGVEIAQPVVNVLAAATQGAKTGFGNAPIAQSPENVLAYQKAGIYPPATGGGTPLQAINQAVLSPVATLGNLGSRVGSALMGAYQGGVSQAGTEIGQPLLGRDLAALPEAFPTGDLTGGTGVPHAPGGPAVAEAATATERNNMLARAAQTHTDALAAPLPGTFLDHPLAPGVAEKVATMPTPAPGNALALGPDGKPVPLPPTPDTTPQPGSVGAAASRDLSPPGAVDMTPAQTQAYRSTAEGQKLLEPQQPGQADRNAYVPGVSASTAEVEQTVNAAREAKAANIAHPEVSQAAKEQAASNNDARGQYFANTAGSDVSLMNLKNERTAAVNADYPAAFANSKPADPAPIVSTIQDMLNDPRGRQNSQLQSYIKPLMDRLQNADGTPKITNPEELYGFREDVNRMMSKASQANDPNLSHVAGELGNIVKSTDGQIETAAPGYRNYMDNYAAKSRQIDEQQVLQDAEPKLYAGSQMTYNKVQTFMRNVVDARQSSGLNPYKSISDDTMQRLWNLRDDLRRSASAQELARTPGSDTTQSMFDLAKRSVAVGGRLAAHGVANHFFPVLGSLGVNAAEGAIGNRLAARAQRQGLAAGINNLNPNRLVPPQP